MKKIALALGIAAALAVPAIAETPAATSADENVLMIAGIRVGNPLDPKTWWDPHAAAEEHASLEINPMDPTFWVGFVDPARHTMYHHTFTNPATAATFMKVETYTAMMDPKVWVKWLDTESYAPLVDLQTYATWMQPGAYGHILNMDHYAQMADLDAYGTVVTAALDVMGLDAWAEAGKKLYSDATE